MSLILGGQQPSAVDAVVVAHITVLGVRVELVHVIARYQQTSARCTQP